MKKLIEALRTKHNQTEELTKCASEELARAKLIKWGADHDLMQALKSGNDMKALLERVQSERNTLWEAVKPLTLLFCKLEDGKKRWVDIVKDIPNRFRVMCVEPPRSMSKMYSLCSKYYTRLSIFSR